MLTKLKNFIKDSLDREVRTLRKELAESKGIFECLMKSKCDIDVENARLRYQYNTCKDALLRMAEIKAKLKHGKGLVIDSVIKEIEEYLDEKAGVSKL